MTHSNQDIVNYHAGDDLRLEVTVMDGGDVKDITASTAEYEIFETYEDDREVHVSLSTDGSSVNIPNGSSGRVDIDIDGSETEGMEGVYEHRLRVTDYDGDTVTVFTGKFHIHP